MRLPILTYHSLDNSGSPVSVAPATFRRQLARLRGAGYVALPLGEALALLARPDEPRRRLVALTFDDGYASVREHALPALAPYGWRATVLPVSDYVGRDNVWPSQPSFVPRAPLLSWEGLAELAGLGWEIAAHTKTHPDLTRLDDDALEAEVVDGAARLEQHLGRPVKTFAYPYGKLNPRVRAAVQRRYDGACSTAMGLANRTSDRYALERVEMWYFSRWGLHRLLGSPGLAPYVGLCGAVRRARAAVGRQRGS